MDTMKNHYRTRIKEDPEEKDNSFDMLNLGYIHDDIHEMLQLDLPESFSGISHVYDDHQYSSCCSDEEFDHESNSNSNYNYNNMETCYLPILQLWSFEH